MGNNITDDLRAKGFNAGSSIGHAYETDGTLGGPILRDRLWFFGSYRQFGESLLPADVYDDSATDRTNWFIANQTLPQATEDAGVYSGSLRLTSQLNQGNKLTFYYDRPFRYTSSTNSARPFYTPSETTYYTHRRNGRRSSRTSSCSTRPTPSPTTPGLKTTPRRPSDQSAAPRTGSPSGSRGPGHRPVLEADEPARGPARHHPDPPCRGGHSVVRHRLAYGQGGLAVHVGLYGETATYNGDLVQQYRNGVPDSVRVYNTPVEFFNSVSGEISLYAQDAWTIKRLTINGGARVDRLVTQVDSTSVPQGRFTPFERVQPEIKMPVWTTLSPRLGFAYDLFGDAKTAVKGSWGKYIETWGTGFAQQYNSVAVRSETRTWNDLNADDIAQDAEIGPPADSNFGRVVALTRSPDPDIDRAYNLSSSLGVEHQLLPALGVSFMWYPRGWHDLTRTDNDLVTLADYTPVDIVSPLDGTIITAYNLNAEKRGQVQQVDRNSTDSSTRRNAYNSFELSLTGRLPGGGRAFGGWTVDRTIDVACDSRDNPNTLRFCDQSEIGIPYQHEFKFSVVQPLPVRFQAGFTLADWPGGPSGARAFAPAGSARFTGLSTNWSLSRTTRYAADCLGPCTPGALVIPNLTEATLVVPLVPPGEEFTERFVQVSVQLQKIFRFGEKRLTTGLQVFNLMNSSAVLQQNQTYGTSLGRPELTPEPRVFQASVRFDF